MKQSRKTRRRLVVGLVLVLVASLTLVSAQFSRNVADELSRNATGRALLETFGALTTNYLTDIDEEAVLEGAIKGMIEALDDPFTSYLPPDEAARSNEDRSGSFEGIGATLSPLNRNDNTGVEIINVFRGGPAATAGLKRGDIIVEVDGINVEKMELGDVVGLIRGPGGTPVEIGVLRPSSDEPIIFSIVRDTIEIVSVESAVLPDNVGYVAVRTFANTRVHDQLVEQLAQLQAQGISSLILDLRDNGGGLLQQGILVADEFLSSGDIVFQRARGITQRLASADPAAFELPMVVLVNENSASASEIVAGALQENGRALVVGEETFGKGVGQTVTQLANGGQLVLLNFEWLTPKRNSINKKGIAPDVFVKDTRFPELIRLDGEGGDPGEEITFSVGEQVIGTTTVKDDGTFSFVSPFRRPDISDVQGEAIVDLDNDTALQVARETVLELVEQPLVGN